MKKRMIYYTSTEKNCAVMAIESGAMLSNTYNIVIFATQREAEAYAAKRDGNKNHIVNYGRKILTYK